MVRFGSLLFPSAVMDQIMQLLQLLQRHPLIRIVSQSP